MPKSEADDHLGTKLATAIREKGVSQKDVAEHFNVKPPSVSVDWLVHGRIAKKHIPKLVRYFERPYEWWFEDGATNSKGAPRTFAAGLSMRLREAMRRRGYMKADSTMNVSALAKNAKCSPSTIMMWLNADNPPTFIDAFVLLQLCDELSVTPYWLVWNQGTLEDVSVNAVPMQSLRGKAPPRRRQIEETT